MGREKSVAKVRMRDQEERRVYGRRSNEQVKITCTVRRRTCECVRRARGGLSKNAASVAAAAVAASASSFVLIIRS